MAAVLDACAMIAYLRGEPGSEMVKDFIELPDCCAHGINLCEVGYKFSQAAGETVSRSALRDIYRAGVRIREDLDADFRRSVIRFKAQYPFLSLADCCVLALAKRLDAKLVTADREFKKASQEVKIVFIR
jgi:ribonuclease VapC